MPLETLLSAYPWGVYALVFLAPFIQEDAAVIGAASASMTGAADPFLLFAALLLGLSISDTWKYWLGRAAHAHGGLKALSGKEKVLAARERILKRLGVTLFIARFVPGTRIPLYVASGFFKAPFPRFAAFVVGSGALYAGLMFAVFHLLGRALGEQAHVYIPAAAVLLLVSFLVVRYLSGRRKPASAAQ